MNRYLITLLLCLISKQAFTQSEQENWDQEYLKKLQQQEVDSQPHPANPYGIGTYGGFGIGLGGGLGGWGTATADSKNNPQKTPAEKVKIKFSGSEKVAECQYELALKVYYCVDGNQKTIIKNNIYAVTGFSFDETNKKLKPVHIEEMTDDKNEVIYSTRKLYASIPGMDTNPMNLVKPPEMVQAIAELNYINSSVEPLLGKDVESKFYKRAPIDSYGSVDFEKQFSPLRKHLTNRKETLAKALEDKNLEVEFEDNTKIRCERNFDLRTLTKHEKESFDKSFQTYGKKIQCEATKCDDVTIDGKKYSPLLVFDSSPYSVNRGEVFLIGKDQGKTVLGPTPVIKKITSKETSVPLTDNSPFLNNKVSGMPNYHEMMMKEFEKTLPKNLVNKSADILRMKDPNREGMIRFNSEYCREPKELLNDYFSARKSFLEDLANAEVAQYIKILEGGRLSGSYVSSEFAQSEGCLYQGVFIDLKSLEHIEKIKKNIHPDKNAETISLDRANELFKKATQMSDIAWKYKPDGCYARAHLMARRFEKEGVRVDKVWIKGDLSVPEANIRWNFHVAPIVYVEEKGQIKKMVIDPSLFDRPVTVEEWDAKMQKNTARGSVVTAFPFPENSAFFERSTLSFSSSDPYLPLDSVNLSEEEKMRMANQTMANYKPLEQ